MRKRNSEPEWSDAAREQALAIARAAGESGDPEWFVTLYAVARERGLSAEEALEAARAIVDETPPVDETPQRVTDAHGHGHGDDGKFVSKGGSGDGDQDQDEDDEESEDDDQVEDNEEAADDGEGEWSQAGINDPGAWQEAGFEEASDAAEWAEAGFGAEDAAAWVEADLGLSVEEARTLADAGLDPRAADEFYSFGEFNHADAVPEIAAWAEAGFGAKQASEWHAAGYSPDEARELADAGLDASTADRYGEALVWFEPTAVATFAEVGLSPAAAAALGQSEHFAAEVFDAGSWGDAEDPEEYADLDHGEAWRELGIGAAEAAELDGAGVEPDQVKPAIAAGISYEAITALLEDNFNLNALFGVGFDPNQALSVDGTARKRKSPRHWRRKE